MNPQAHQLHAGAAQINITPAKPVFLFGYPGVARISTGIHDPLLASSLWLQLGATSLLFIACDLIWVPRDLSHRARRMISQSTGIPFEHILISATHTHSGPVTTQMISNLDDPLVPPPDAEYLHQLQAGIVQSALTAHQTLRPASLYAHRATAEGLGTNRRDPTGPHDARLPVLVVRQASNDQLIALMTVCAMHPTVLHEDSTLISGDFPGIARQILQRELLPIPVPVIYHMGCSGNQSPRHVVTANNLSQATRLGRLLANQLHHALEHGQLIKTPMLSATTDHVDLPKRTLPELSQAQAQQRRIHDRYQQLKASSASRSDIRTAECDTFGADELVTLCRAASDGTLHAALAELMPAEIQAFQVGPWTYIGWPGECFVEFGLLMARHHPDTFAITLCNGDLQGYLVTAQAVAEGGYEASNATFASPQSGELLVQRTLRMLERLHNAQG